MKYENAKAIYIPSIETKRYGETNGYRRYLRDRNRNIRQSFAQGKSIGALAEAYCLSVESIRRIVYSKKKNFIMDYTCTLLTPSNAASTA